MTYAAHHRDFASWFGDKASTRSNAVATKAGVLRRIFDAIFESRQKQVDRDITRFLARSGGRARNQPTLDRIRHRNPFGLYFYMQDVDALAAEFRHETKGPKDMPWGMYEFSMSDPDETLVRVGWPSRLRKSAQTVV